MTKSKAELLVGKLKSLVAKSGQPDVFFKIDYDGQLTRGKLEKIVKVIVTIPYEEKN